MTEPHIRSGVLLALCLVGCRGCEGVPEADSGNDEATDTSDPRDSGTTTDTNDSGADLLDQDADGFVAGDDCDDTDPEIHPEATEICNDGIDQDCNPDSPECELDLGEADAALLGEEAGHYAGVSVDPAGDVNGDGYADLLVGAKRFDSDGDEEGAAYLIYGPIEDKGGNLDDLGVRMEGVMASSNAGVQVLGMSDLDGDGTDEVFVSATTVGTDGLNKNGEVYYFPGNTLASHGPGSVLSLNEATATWTGTAGFQWLGGAFSDVGDVDGDTIPDLVIGSTGTAENVSSGGTVYLMSGQRVLNSSGTQRIDDAYLSAIHGIDERGYLGSRLTGPGDMNGDGLADIVIGAPLLNETGSESGSVFVLSMPPTGAFDIDASNSRLNGSDAGDQLGAAVAPAGDVDNDGYMDLWVGSAGSDAAAANGGSAYLILGDADPTLLNGVAADIAHATVSGAGTDAGLGSTLDGNGDFDGDGIGDLLAGGSDSGASGEGGAWLFLGPFEGTLESDQARAALFGDAPGDHAGTSVDFSPSLGENDTDWLVIGAWQDDENGIDSGAVFLLGHLSE